MVEGAVVALEVDGEGVEVGGEDDDAVVGAVPGPVVRSGVSVIEDILQRDQAKWRFSCSRYLLGCSPRILFFSKKRGVRCVTIRPTSGDEAVENDG